VPVFTTSAAPVPERLKRNLGGICSNVREWDPPAVVGGLRVGQLEAASFWRSEPLGSMPASFEVALDPELVVDEVEVPVVPVVPELDEVVDPELFEPAGVPEGLELQAARLSPVHCDQSMQS